MRVLERSELIASIGRVRAGSQAAWTELAERLLPHIESIVASAHSMGPLRDSEDHRRNALAETLSKLARNNYRALELLPYWLDANVGKDASDWLRIVVTNVIREYVATRLGGGRRAPDEVNKRMLHTLAAHLTENDDSPSLRPPVTDVITAREILEYAARHLPEPQLRALEAWLSHCDFAEIGRAAGLVADAARGGERLVRAALARLRRQFALETSSA